MPMSRYQIRNEYSLADPELYRAADKDDPEALLEGVAMAGLVGVLRQLGDLAEFAAEIFHDLHEEVMATATRGHSLIVRVQQLEAEFPSIEKASLSQTSHSAFFSNAGTDWHPSLHTNQNLITQGDLPRFIMDSYEECRGPPRLFLLDKFDVAGAGACLKRYTDPSFFKVEASSYGLTNAEVQREKKSRKAKKKGSRWRNGGTPEISPTSHAKLHQLFLEERVENGVSDPARLVKLKRRLNGFPFDSKTGKSYMEKFISTSSPEDKLVHEISYNSSPMEVTSKITGELDIGLLENGAVSSVEEPEQRKRSLYTSSSVERKPLMDEACENLSDGELLSGLKEYPHSDTGTISPIHEMIEEKEIAVDEETKLGRNKDGYHSDDIASEENNYMDALATMDSEIETDTEFRSRNDVGLMSIEKQGIDSDANVELLQAQFSDSRSALDDGNSSIKKGIEFRTRNDVEKQGSDSDANAELLQSQFSDSRSTGNSSASDDGNSSLKNGISSFSCSGTGSTSVENMSVDDVSAKVSLSNEIRTEVSNVSIENVSINEELTVSQLAKHESSHKWIEVAEIPSNVSEFGQLSCTSCLSDSAPTRFPLSEGEILALDTSRGSELVEMSFNHGEIDNKSIKTEEHDDNQDAYEPLTSNISVVSPQLRNDDVPLTEIMSAENSLVDKLDEEDPIVPFNASSQSLDNILEVVPKKYSCESSLDNVLQTEVAQDTCKKNLLDTQINSPPPGISDEEDEPSLPSTLEFEDHNSDVLPEVITSVDHAVPSARELTVNSTLAADDSSDLLFTEQQGAEQTDDVPPLKFGSAVGISYGQETPDEVLGRADIDEMDGITPTIDLIGSEATGFISIAESPVIRRVDDNGTNGISPGMNFIVSEALKLENTSDFSNHVGPRSLTDFQGDLDENKSERGQEDTIPAFVSSSDTTSDANDSLSKANSRAEYIHSIEESYLNEFEVHEDCLQQSCNTSGKPKELIDLEIAPPNSDSVQYERQFSDHTNSESVIYVPDVSLAAEADSRLHPDEATISSSSHYSDQDSEPNSSQKHNFSEPFDDTLNLPPYHESEVRTSFEQKLTIEDDQLDIDYLHDDETHTKEISQLGEAQSLGHMDEESCNTHYEPCPGASNPVVQVNVQINHLDAESLHQDEASCKLSSKLEEVQYINHTDNGRNSHTSPKISSMPDKTIEPETPQLGRLDIDGSEQARDQVSVCPDFPLLPGVSQINLKEMPPLPPLPPMQWRMGKPQNASPPPDKDAMQNTPDCFPTIFPFKNNNNSQMDYPMLNQNGLLPPVPVLPLLAAKDENYQHVNEHLASNIGHSSPFSAQMLRTSSNRNDLDILHTSGSECNDSPQHGVHAGGVLQSNFNSFLTAENSGDAAFTCSSGSHPEIPSHGLHNLPLEASPESENSELPSTSSEAMMIKFPDTALPQPTVADEAQKDVSTTSKGEIASSSNSLFAAVEDGMLIGNRPMKLLRPRSPLIDAVAAHDKSKLRKVTERVRPEIQKVEERDNLLEQIRTKSFNLKPAVVARPSIQGPKTNLRVAAILEKANAIRQALAGSDEDDDEDSWSDS